MFRLRLQIPIKLRITITWTACRRDFRSPGRRRFTRICLSTGSNHRLTRSVSRIDLRTRILIHCSFWRHDDLSSFLSFFSLPFLYFSSDWRVPILLVTMRCKSRFNGIILDIFSSIQLALMCGLKGIVW